MVTEWGMSDAIGNMYLGASEEVFLGRDYQTQLNYSDAMAAKIDGEIKSIIDTQYQKALSILKDNREIMDKMVKLLYAKETIYENEIDALFEGASLEELLGEEDGAKKDEGAKTAEPVIALPAKTDAAPKAEDTPKDETPDNAAPAGEGGSEPSGDKDKE